MVCFSLLVLIFFFLKFSPPQASCRKCFPLLACFSTSPPSGTLPSECLSSPRTFFQLICSFFSCFSPMFFKTNFDFFPLLLQCRTFPPPFLACFPTCPKWHTAQ